MVQLVIDESTKVAALLDSYPELEDLLIRIAPPFKKLRNPVLRRSVAKVASLRQAAAVARIPASELVNQLREAVGQPPIALRSDDASVSYLGECPAWYDPDLVVDVLDERALPDDGPMPLVSLLKRAQGLGEGDILEFRTTFLPAPASMRCHVRGSLCGRKRILRVSSSRTSPRSCVPKHRSYPRGGTPYTAALPPDPSVHLRALAVVALS